jgi:hypothetical protein
MALLARSIFGVIPTGRTLRGTVQIYTRLVRTFGQRPINDRCHERAMKDTPIWPD